MNKSNLIFLLAEHALRHRLSRGRLREESDNLWDRDDIDSQVLDAIKGIHDPRVSSRMVQMIARICLNIFRDNESKAQIHGESGNELASRNTVGSLRLAVQHLRRARQYVARDDPRYGMSFIKEGEARCRLAELGVEPLENPRLTIRLCARAKRLFAPDSVFYAETLMVKGAAHMFLARAGQDCRRNIVKGVRLCHRARLLFDKCSPESPDCGAARMLEARVRHCALEFGIGVRANLLKEAKLLVEARSIFGASAHHAGSATANEGLVHITLASLGTTPPKSLKKAIKRFKQSRRLLLLEKDHPKFRTKFGRAFLNQGLARESLADLGVEPVENLQSAIVLYRKARTYLNASSPDYGAALLNEGAARTSLYGYGIDAEANLRESAALYAEAEARFPVGGDDHCRAVVNRTRAEMRLAHGRVDALEVYDDAIEHLEAVRKSVDSKSVTYARLTIAEADVWEARAEQFMGAIERQEKLVALDMLTAHRPLRRPEVLDEIRRCLDQALRLSEEGCSLLISGSDELARGLVNQASARLSLICWGGAEAADLARVLNSAERAGDLFERGSFSWCKSLYLQACALRDMGSRDKAYDKLRTAIQAAEDLRGQMRREPERIGFQEEIRGWYADIVEVCLDLCRTAEQADEWQWQAWHWAHRSKSRALVDLLGSVRPRLSSELEPLWRQYEETIQLFNACAQHIRLLRCRGDRSTEQVPASLQSAISEKLRDLEKERDKLGEALRLQRSRLATAGAEAFSLQRGETPKSSQEVLASLRELAGVDATPHDGRKPLFVELFFVHHKEVVLFLLPLWEDCSLSIERVSVTRAFSMVLSFAKAIEELQEPRVEGDGEKSRSAYEKVETVCNEMSSLIEPWANHLEEWQPTDLILSPHGELSLVPLHAAVWKGKPLIEHFAVAYLPSPVLAAELLRRRKHLSGTALFLGNPSGDLPSAEAEVNSAAEWATKRGLHPQVFVGEDATSECVSTFAPSAALVHFACHSVLDADNFTQSGVELAEGRRLTVEDLSLTCELKRAALVFLSSCDSARPAPVFMDELLALVRVFFYAGSPTVIATLWRLNEGVGAYFADFFYKFWLGEEGNTKMLAFQKAMNELRKEYPNPYDWAPLVLMGEWHDSNTAIATGDSSPIR